MKTVAASVLGLLLVLPAFTQETNESDTADVPVAADEARGTPPAEQPSADTDSKESGVRISATGSNLLQFGRGERLPEPGITSDATDYDYLTNSLDLRLNIGAVFGTVRFNIDEPSRAIAGTPYYREYFSRRALGLKTEQVEILAGHFLTSIGRGLSLNIREDRTLDTANVLDGGLLRAEFPFASVQALVGRPVGKPVSTAEGIFDLKDLSSGDLTLGASAEIFPLYNAAKLSAFSGVSIGAGIVNHRVNVGPQLTVATIDSITEYVIDSITSFFDTSLSYVSWQTRTEAYLPSFSLNIPAPWFDLYIEHSRLYTRAYWYDEFLFLPLEGEQKPSYATYLSAATTIGPISLLAEYKDYNYGRNVDYDVPSANAAVVYYADPPVARYRHSWQLLTKHEPVNFITAERGYNIMLVWNNKPGSSLTLDFNTGGRPLNTDYFRFDTTRRYWDLYAEWIHPFGEFLNIRAGVDAAQMDQSYPEDRNFFGALKLTAGPFKRKHSITLQTEFERRSREYPVFDPVLLENTGTRDAWTTNAVVSIGYSLVPWGTITVAWEHAQAPLGLDIAPAAEDYLNVGILIRPTPRHTLSAEYGTMGGGKKCSMGSCFTLPPYRGLRLTLTSTL